MILSGFVCLVLSGLTRAAYAHCTPNFNSRYISMRSEYLPGVSVTVRENDRGLREYDTELIQDVDKATSSYIQSVPGATFTVNLAFDDNYPHAAHDVYTKLSLDGATIQTQKRYKSKYRNISYEGVARGYGDESTYHKLTFAELKTTEGHADASTKDQVAKLGDIDVKIYRCQILDLVPRKKQQRRTPARTEAANTLPETIESIPEKALKGKAMSAHAAIGKGEPMRARQQSTKTTHTHGKVLLAVYTFKCRSRRDLQIEGIISRSPSPLPLEERDVEDLSPEELRELVRRQRECRSSQPSVKRDGKGFKRERSTTIISDGGDDGENDVEMMAGGSQRKRPRMKAEIETIDLSGD